MIPLKYPIKKLIYFSPKPYEKAYERILAEEVNALKVEWRKGENRVEIEVGNTKEQWEMYYERVAQREKALTKKKDERTNI